VKMSSEGFTAPVRQMHGDAGAGRAPAAHGREVFEFER